MTLKIGDKLPNGTLLSLSEEGPVSYEIDALTKSKKVLIFGLPGAFTPTCTNDHLPGYINNAPEFFAKGIDAIYCVCVNDVFVADAWAKMIGAQNAQVQVLADASGDWIKSIGLNFDAPPAGLYSRSKRFSLIADNQVVTVLEVEESPGVCQLSAATNMLELV